MTNAQGAFVGVDVGGTKVLAGTVGPDGSLGATARRATPGRRVEPQQVEDALVDAVLEVADDRALLGVGVAAAGFVNLAGDRVMFAPHLPWRGEPLRDRLQDRLGCPVVLDNDATCAALAEWTYGAARGTESALMITLGTGIGGGIVTDRQLVRGANGMAGEFGHMKVVPGGHPCECGGAGCWEQYCSGKALERLARSRLGIEPTVLEEACGGDPRLLTGSMVAAAADEGDLVAQDAFRAMGDWLGVGVANLVAAFDPEVVVIGGGVAAVGERLLEPARNALVRSLVGNAHRTIPPLVGALLGPEAGLIGAATLARRGLADQGRR